MGFKTKPKYKLVKENWAGSLMQSVEEFEITPEEILNMTYGCISPKMFAQMIEWLKKEEKNK